jgi:hypothetical protein
MKTSPTPGRRIQSVIRSTPRHLHSSAAASWAEDHVELEEKTKHRGRFAHLNTKRTKIANCSVRQLRTRIFLSISHDFLHLPQTLSFSLLLCGETGAAL